jgi:hypothetical protein
MNETKRKILEAVLSGFSADGWDYWIPVRSLDIPGYGRVEVVSFTVGSFDYQDGTPSVIVFKLTDKHSTEVKYFRKSGYVTSYGEECDWAGEFIEVKPVERTVVEYV